MTDTNDIREEFSPLLDDELSPDARDAVEAKLAQDANLLRELDALRKVDELYRGLPRASAPDDMAARVSDRLHPKPKVLPLRTRQFSRTLYPSLAAAAMFGVLIGGVVIRNEFVVSPSAEDRITASAPVADEFAAAEAPEKEASGVFDDAVSTESLFEKDADNAQPERPDSREMVRESAAQSEPRSRQESIENAPDAVSEAAAPAGGTSDVRSKNEAKAKPQAVGAAAPPPSPVTLAPSEDITLGRSVGKAGEETTPMALREDMADLPSDVEARSDLGKKRANVVERIANREFDQREDGWYQRGYNGEPTQIVKRDSETMSTLVAAIPGLKDVLALKGDIVLQHDETWYRIPAAPEN